MPNRPPLSGIERERLRELHAEGKTRNQIARELKRAQSTVSKAAAAMGLDFERTRTAAATRAKVADARDRRAELSLGLLDDVARLRGQLFTPTTLHAFGGRDNTHNSRDIPEPLPADKLKLMQSIGAAIDRHVKLVDLDADTGADDAKAMLTGLADALGTAWRAGQPDQP